MFGRLRFHVRSHACIAVLAAILITMWLASAAGAFPGQRDHSRHAHSKHGGPQIGHQVPGHGGPPHGQKQPGHGGPPPGQKGPGHGFPQPSYLALGDSLAFGYSQAKFEKLLPNENPAEYNTGYVDDFARLLEVRQPQASGHQ